MRLPDAHAASKNMFLWPALLVVLFLSVFPLIGSLYLSFSKLDFTADGISIRFLGLNNFNQIFFGSERGHTLGVFGTPTLLGWAIFAAVAALLVAAFLRSARVGRVSQRRLLLRAIGGLLLLGLAWAIVHAVFATGGRPGTIIVTLTYVFVGIAVQYVIGLALALLVTQHVRGRRFFRVVFLLPMMITPVGVAYMFRMLTDTSKGPFVPLISLLGQQGFTWVNDPWLARGAVMIGDAWQWIPFMFIVLLAALEAQDVQVTEAAMVDGASGRAIFRHITLWAILPVSTTLVLIRMIEAFKIVDLPNILTNGGPGTATESLTLQAFFDWRTLNLGRSAALSYTLLILVTVIATVYINYTRRKLRAE